MKVKDQIQVLQKAIDKLKKLDPKLPIQGHIAYPNGGYRGDLDGEIYLIDVEVEDEVEDEDGNKVPPVGVALGVYYK